MQKRLAMHGDSEVTLCVLITTLFLYTLGMVIGDFVSNLTEGSHKEENVFTNCLSLLYLLPGILISKNLYSI